MSVPSKNTSTKKATTEPRKFLRNLTRHSSGLLAILSILILTFTVAQADDSFSKKRAESLGGQDSVNPENPLVGETLGKKGTGFFATGSVNDIFGEKEAQLTEQPELQMLNGRARKEKESKDKLTAQPVAEKTTPKSLLQKYGSPDVNLPVLAQPDAPKSFQAVMEAIQSGDDKLAYRYARQHVRYMRDVGERTKKVVQLNQVAMEQEGIVPRQAQGEEPDYEGSSQLITDSFKADADKSKIVELNQRTKELIAQAEQDDAILGSEKTSSDVAANKPALYRNEKEERAALRAQFAGKYPVDPQHKLKFYLFVNPEHYDAGTHVQQLQALFDKTRDDRNVSVAVLTITRFSAEEIKQWARNIGAKVPVYSGAELAAQLGVSKAPTFAIIAPTTGEAVIEEGLRTSVFVDEAAKYVQGKQ